MKPVDSDSRVGKGIKAAGNIGKGGIFALKMVVF
jgi:hypothetical protein